LKTSEDRRAVFYNNPTSEGLRPPVRIGWVYLLEFLRDGRTPIRAVSDEAIRHYLPLLYGPGRIIELGAPSDYYRRFVPAEQDYHITDGSEYALERVDMTRMPFEAETVDAFVSIFSLEHIYEYGQAIAEVERTLKPGGRFLLVMPFLYYFHGAPDDYIRLTRSGLLRLLNRFRILVVESLGNRALFTAEMYHEKTEMGHRSSALRRFWLRLLGTAFVGFQILRPSNDEAYASAYLVVCEKR
jgi:SAM-dependent methyltransferase